MDTLALSTLDPTLYAVLIVAGLVLAVAAIIAPARNVLLLAAGVAVIGFALAWNAIALA